MQRQVRVVAAVALVVLVLAIVRTARAGDPSPSPAITQARIVNVTSDSAPGWLPTTDQARAASEAALAYLAARDAGRTEVAYAMLEDGNRALQPFAAFSRDLTAFSRFANIDRDCGYLVVYQPPAGGPFRVAHEEVNFMTNADAATIERQKSKAAMEAAWSQLSTLCPNSRGKSAHLPRAAPRAGGFHRLPDCCCSPDRPALAAWCHLQNRKRWTIATDDASHTIWVFASEGQPAYPAAIKRQFVGDGHGGTSLNMSVLCEASKADCDNLVRTFEALDARVAAEPRDGR
jgi:hypothetical protein